MTNIFSIVAIGAAHIERRAISDAPFAMGASGFGIMHEDVGGAALNAAIVLRCLGAQVSLMSARGGDADGAAVQQTLDAWGIDDLTTTWLDRATPAYTAVLDQKGCLVAGVLDARLYERMAPKLMSRSHIRAALTASDAIVLDTNLPKKSIDRVVELADTRPVSAIGVSVSNVGRLEAVLPKLAGLFVSRAEAASLTGMASSADLTSLASAIGGLGVRNAVVTDGSDAAAVVEDGAVWLQASLPVERVRNASGAGETLAATTALLHLPGERFVEAARVGMAAAGSRAAGLLPFDMETIRRQTLLMPPPRRCAC